MIKLNIIERLIFVVAGMSFIMIILDVFFEMQLKFYQAIILLLLINLITKLLEK